MLRRRRWLWLIPGALALALGLALAATPLAERAIRTKVLPRIEDRLGRRLLVGDIQVRPGRVELTDVVVDGAGAPAPLSVPRLKVGFRLWPLLLGRLSLTRVTLERPHVEIVRSESGDDNVATLIERLRAERREARASGSGGGGRRRGPEELEVVGGSIAVSDDTLGSFEAGLVDAVVRPQGEGSAILGEVEIKLLAGPSAHATRLDASFAIADGKLQRPPSIKVAGGAVKVWKGFAVSGVQGGIAPEADAAAGAAGQRVMIDLEGGYGGVDKILWSAKGWAEPAGRQGEVHLVAARFDLGQLAPILVRTPIQHPSEAEVDARLDLVFHGDTSDPRHLHDALDFDGAFHLLGLTVFHPRLGPRPVRHIGFNAEARGRLEPRAHTLRVDAASVDFRGVRARMDLEVTKLDKLGRQQARAARGGPGARPPAMRADFPAFRGALGVDTVPCQSVLEALPPELVPSLKGFRLDGTFHSAVRAAIDTDNLDEMELGSEVGIDGCRVREAPAAFSAARLFGDFQHAVEVEPGNWITFAVGRENPNFVPLDHISRNVVNSIMTTEDSNFLKHRGFIAHEFKSALKANLESGYFRFGASSITMQLVKNVLLSREKTLSRKLQELFLTWYLEHQLSKARILEIYLNVIEFGPGIYGIGRAAHHYFGKPASELSPKEAAFFSSILPNPKRGYKHYCNGPQLEERWEQYLNRILKYMHERGRLTDAEYQLATSTPLAFDRREASSPARCLELVRRITAVGPDGSHLAAAGDSLPAAVSAETDEGLVEPLLEEEP